MLEFDPTTFVAAPSHPPGKGTVCTNGTKPPRILKRIIVCCDGYAQLQFRLYLTHRRRKQGLGKMV